MDQDDKQTPEREPKEPGTEEVQQPSPRDLADFSLIKSGGGIEGHPLPETLRGLAQAFRSYPAWMLIVQWTSQITKESDQIKSELTQTRQELEGEKIRSAKLEVRLAGFKQIASLKTFVQAVGTLMVGLAPALYEYAKPLYGLILLFLGLILIAVGWGLGKFKD